MILNPSYILVLFYVAFLSSGCTCSKILFYFGGGSYSHKTSAWPWAIALADKGHEITFLSAYEKRPSDHANIKDLSSTSLYKAMKKSYGIDRFAERRDGKHSDFLRQYSKISVGVCRTLLYASEPGDYFLHPLIQNGTFDLVVVNIIFGECGFLIARHLGAKTIVYDASVNLPWFPDTYGTIPESSWVPDISYNHPNSVPLDFIDRLKNTYLYMYWHLDRVWNLHPQLERLNEEYFKLRKSPSYLEMERNASLVMVNTHPGIDFALSLPPVCVMVGGMNAFMPEKEIPSEYKKFLDGAGEAGAVLISFGSTVDLETVPLSYQEIIFKLIRKHKDVRFLLKWKGPYPKGFETGMNNLMASDWVPQRELLRHPKLQAFVTHGGLNSIQEATFYGVPLVVLPLFADQDYNGYRIEAQKVGFRLEIATLTYDLLDAAVNRILADKQYKHNMEVKSKLFRDRPLTPVETVVYWTEFVLRQGDTSALKPMTRHLSWYQLRLLDVYFAYFLILLTASTFLILITFKIIQFSYRCLFRSAPNNNNSKLKTS